MRFDVSLGLAVGESNAPAILRGGLICGLALAASFGLSAKLLQISAHRRTLGVFLAAIINVACLLIAGWATVQLLER